VTKVTLIEAVDEYLLDCKARNLRPCTVKTYGHMLRAFVAFVGQAAHLDEVTPRILRRHMLTLVDAGKVGTAVTAGRCLRAFLNWCKDERLVRASPWRHVRLPERDLDLPDIFTLPELTTLLQAASTIRDRAVMLAMLDTGLRGAELVTLSFESIDLLGGRLIVRATKRRRARVAFLGNVTSAAMGDYLMASPAHPGGAFWRTHDGRPWSREGLHSTLIRLQQATGVRAGTHRFRRTFATWANWAGMERNTVRELLGQRDESQLDRYIRPADGWLQAAHAKYGPVDRYLAGLVDG
jgi:site-specific recombinase XerD